MADLIGTQIAGYRIESRISRGGMGEVYLAEQDSPRRRVALKLLSPELSEDPGFRERFVRESEAAASIDHPNVIPIYASGEANGALFIAMRYVEGTDLGTLLAQRGPLEPERAIHLCAQIADALEASHERGLVHRDVKPANILVGRSDHAYLSDFGLIRRSEVSSAITKTGQFMGTIDYVAPEQIKGEAADGRADVYSLGCVLYECLAGGPPFRRETEVATLYAHLEEPPPVPSATIPAVPPALDQVVAKAMAKRPDERYTTASELEKAIAATMQPETAAARRLLGQRQRRRLTAAIVGGVGVAVVIALVALVATSRPETPEEPAPGAVPPLNSVIQVDAESGKILSTVSGIPSVGVALPKVEFGEDAAWVLAASNVSHIDPVTERIVATTSFGSAFNPSESLAVWSRTVWIGAAPGIVRINPATGEALRSVRLEGGSATDTYIAAGGPNLWAVNGGQLTRIDGLGRRIGKPSDIGQSSSGIGVGLDSVWVVDDLHGTLSKIDPETMKLIQTTSVAGDIDAIDVGAGRVWILDSTAGVVTPFDPDSLDAESPIRVGEHPTDIAIGLGAIWVTDQGDGTISRIDPVTLSVDKIRVGAPVAALAVDQLTHSLWVAIAERRAGGD